MTAISPSACLCVLSIPTTPSPPPHPYFPHPFPPPPALSDVSFNSISGAVPGGISGSTALTFLDLHGNRLDGSLPAELGAIQGLEHL